MYVGEVVRCDSRTFIYNLEGRRTNASRSELCVSNAHHIGRNVGVSSAPPGSSRSILPLRSCARIVYIDANRLGWCSVGSVVCRLFVWPRSLVRSC